MPLRVYFRSLAQMPDLERIALEACRGHVLDIGAGAGSHALALQQRGFRVAALDCSPGATAVMRDRGIRQVVMADVFTYESDRYDTLLLLMNGLGIAGDLQGLLQLLTHSHKLLQPGGQILADSSDLEYLYDETTPKPTDRYYGIINCRYEYKGQFTPWFNWLYVDQATLRDVAARAGFSMDVVFAQEDGQYLALLARNA